MGVCLLEQSIGGGTQELGLSSSPVGDVYSAGKYTNLSFGSFRFPGACAVSGSSNAYITAPGLITITNMRNNQLAGEVNISAQNSSQSGFETITNVPVKTQDRLLACFVKKLSKALTGLAQDVSIMYEGGFDTSGWDYRFLQSGTSNLSANYFTFPALLEDDTVTFYIPCAISQDPNASGETQLEVTLAYAKASSTKLQFYWRKLGTSTKYNVVALPAGSFDIKVETFGLTVTSKLASASGVYAAGIVSPVNTTSAVNLTWLLLAKNYAVRGGDCLAPFFTPADSTTWQWYADAKDNKVGGHLVNIKGSGAEQSSLVYQTADPQVGFILDATRPEDGWLYLFSVNQFPINEYVGADIKLRRKCYSVGSAPAMVGVFYSNTSGQLARSASVTGEDAYNIIMGQSVAPIYKSIPPSTILETTTVKLRWNTTTTADMEIGIFMPRQTGDTDSPIEVYIEDMVFLKKTE